VISFRERDRVRWQPLKLGSSEAVTEPSAVAPDARGLLHDYARQKDGVTSGALSLLLKASPASGATALGSVTAVPPSQPERLTRFEERLIGSKAKSARGNLPHQKCLFYRRNRRIGLSLGKQACLGLIDLIPPVVGFLVFQGLSQVYQQGAGGSVSKSER
jgi:hypothetical protein